MDGTQTRKMYLSGPPAYVVAIAHILCALWMPAAQRTSSYEARRNRCRGQAPAPLAHLWPPNESMPCRTKFDATSAVVHQNAAIAPADPPVRGITSGHRGSNREHASCLVCSSILSQMT